MNIAIVSPSGATSYINSRTPSSNEEVVSRFHVLLLSYVSEETGQGTGLLSGLRTGKIMSSAGVQSQFVLAATKVLQQMGDQSEFSSNQQIIRAELKSFKLASGKLDLVISLVTADPATKITSRLSLQ